MGYVNGPFNPSVLEVIYIMLFRFFNKRNKKIISTIIILIVIAAMVISFIPFRL